MSFKQRSIKIPFRAGAPMMIAGPTTCGKTTWIKKLLSSKHNFTEPVKSILYCFGVHQPLYDEMKETIPDITFHKGLPSQDEVESYNDGHFHIIVIDDLMERVMDNIDAQMLFTKFCHHFNITTIFITQNLLAQGRCARTIALNTLILVLFQNYRDRSQVNTLARQQCPSLPSLFTFAVDDATQRPYGYLVVDCTPQCPDDDRWRTNIFQDEPNGKR